MMWLLWWIVEHWFISWVVFWIIIKIIWITSFGICQDTSHLKGKTVIITGANSGIGKEIARDLAYRGARVIMACWNMDKAKLAKDDVVFTTGNSNIILKYVDMSCMRSIREFVKQIEDTEDRLDILINNAGILSPETKIMTEENLELQVATNYFGPFLLTNLLIGLLKKSAPSRIINVGSSAAFWVSVQLDNLNSEKQYHRYFGYGRSKLATMILAKELSRRLKDTGVTVNVARPGGSSTALFRHLHQALRGFLDLGGYFYIKTASEGAQSIIYAAVAKELEGQSGKLIADCKIERNPTEMDDIAVATKLWEKSLSYTGLKPEEQITYSI